MTKRKKRKNLNLKCFKIHQEPLSHKFVFRFILKIYLECDFNFFFFKLKVISLSKSSRYQPLKDVSSGGIIILRDTQSDQPETLVETVKGTFLLC